MRLSKAQQSLAFQVPVPAITAEESKAGCCCKQEEKVRQGIALRLHCTRAGECRASGSCRGPYYSPPRLRSACRSWPSPCPSVSLGHSLRPFALTLQGLQLCWSPGGNSRGCAGRGHRAAPQVLKHSLMSRREPHLVLKIQLAWKQLHWLKAV